MTGTLVLVHPDLANDPVGKQGQVGIITSADFGKDEVYVGFGNSPLGYYSSDALLVLKPHNELYEIVLNNVKEMTKQDFKTLMEITILQEKNAASYLRDAMELANSNPQILAYSTESLQQQYGITQDSVQETGRKASIGR